MDMPGSGAITEGRSPLATFFGPEGRRSFGLVHLPDPQRARDLGVVLCAPFGYEAMCSHRSLRHLGEALARAGFPALRFDLHGTGDSDGNTGDDAGAQGCVAAWQESIAAAVALLVRQAGVSRVCLFGLRLGGTLAVAAAARAPVEALVLWAPFPSGKAFVREARAFQLLNGGPHRAQGAGGLEVAGHRLSPRTLDELSALDPLAPRTRPAARALLLGRDDLPEDDRLGARLESLGTAVDRRRPAGYAAMMRDALEAEVPQEAIGEVVSWLSLLAAPGSLQLPAPSPAEAGLVHEGGARLVETPVRFGAGGRLFGLVTERPQGPPDRPAVLLLNVGSNHHVGPHRMYVELARGLARRGATVLRLDVGGLGESAPAGGERENQIYLPAQVAEVAQAVDLACARGRTDRVVLIGLCSGAYLAYQAARRDPRVVGEVLINTQSFDWHPGDPLAIRTRQAGRPTNGVPSIRFYRRAALQWRTWERLLRGQLDLRYIAGVLARRQLGRAIDGLGALHSFLSGTGWEHSEVARELLRFLGRGGRLLLVYSDTDGGLDLMERHLGEGAQRLSGVPGFSLELVARADHTFSATSDRERLQRLICDWVEALAAWRPLPEPLTSARHG